MEWEKGWKGDTVGVPRQREKERTEPQTWDRAVLGTLFRALGMYWLSRGLTLSIVCTHLGTLNPLKALEEESRSLGLCD